MLPYVGAFDIKPPGLFALVAVAESLLGPTLDTLRAVAIFCDAVTATNLLFLGRRFGSHDARPFRRGPLSLPFRSRAGQ